MMGVIGVTGAGQTLGGKKKLKTEEGEEMGGQTKNEQGKIGRPVKARRLRGIVNEKKQPRREMKQMKEP